MKRYITALILSLFALPMAWAGGDYVFALGGSVDDADGYAISALLDYQLAKHTSLSLDVAVTESQAEPSNVSTRSWHLGTNHHWNAWGFEWSLGQSGDPDTFDSNDLRAGFSYASDHWYSSVYYAYRDIDLIFRGTIFNQPFDRVIDVKADGIGISLRYTADSSWSYFLSGRAYDYDRNLAGLNNFPVLRFISPTTSTLADALLDHSASVGVEMPIRKQFLNFQLSRDKIATDKVNIDSAVLGLLTPLGEKSDVDLSIGYSKGEGEGSALFFSMMFFYYGAG